MTKIGGKTGGALGPQSDSSSKETNAFTNALARASSSGGISGNGAARKRADAAPVREMPRVVSSASDATSAPAKDTKLETAERSLRMVNVQLEGLGRQLSDMGTIKQDLASDCMGHTSNRLDLIDMSVDQMKSALTGKDTGSIERAVRVLAGDINNLSSLLAQVGQALTICQKSPAVEVGISFSSGDYGLQIAVSEPVETGYGAAGSIQSTETMATVLVAVEGKLKEATDLLDQARVLLSAEGGGARKALLQRSDGDLKAALQAGHSVSVDR